LIDNKVFVYLFVYNDLYELLSNLKKIKSANFIERFLKPELTIKLERRNVFDLSTQIFYMASLIKHDKNNRKS